jgi:hypothetical protein
MASSIGEGGIGRDITRWIGGGGVVAEGLGRVHLFFFIVGGYSR